MTFIGSKIVQKKLRILNTLPIGVFVEEFGNKKRPILTDRSKSKKL